MKRSTSHSSATDTDDDRLPDLNNHDVMMFYELKEPKISFRMLDHVCLVLRFAFCILHFWSSVIKIEDWQIMLRHGGPRQACNINVEKFFSTHSIATRLS